jgi:hydrogenase maturation protease
MKRSKRTGSRTARAGRVLVVGYGNPLRGDDGIGWRAANALAEGIQDDRVRIVACVQLTPELADSIAEVDRVIFIDASIEMTPGQLRVTRLKTCEHPGEVWTHHLDPPSLVLCARVLYGKTPEALMITMGAASFDCTDELSPRVRKQFPGLLARVREEIAGHAYRPGAAPGCGKTSGRCMGPKQKPGRRKRIRGRVRSVGSAHPHPGRTG